MEKTAKIFIAGHRGLVGSAITSRLQALGFSNLILKTRDELDLMDQKAVQAFFDTEKPEYVIDSAARVGGIQASLDHPAEFLYENLQLQNNVIWAAKETGVKKFLFIGSAIVYPHACPQPMKEEYFMTGEPDPTKAGYAYAKIAGVKLCEFINEEFGMDFTSCLPTNLYGVGDNFDPKTAHVIPSLIRRMDEAKTQNSPEVVVWGTGNARREFLYVDDLVDAILWILENYHDKRFVNVGTGEDVSMRELAEAVKQVVGYKGELVFDASKPEGVPRRLFDVSRLHDAGWHHTTTLETGLSKLYEWYSKNKE